MPKETLQTPEPTIRELEKYVSTQEANLRFLDIGDQDSTHQPMVVVPGFTQGIDVFADFGQALSEQGQRHVYVLNQINRYHKKSEGLKSFDKDHRLGVEDQAAGLLGFLEVLKLTDRPVDFVTNSFASPVAVRAAQIAHERGWKSFDSKAGSHMFMIAPAGSNPDENIVSLGKRFGGWMVKERGVGGYLDPSGQMMKAGVHNATADPAKTVNEVRALAKVKIDYSKLGQIGLRPTILGYSADLMMPYQIMGTNLESNLDQLAGIAMPIDRAGIGAGDFKTFKQRSGLSGKAAQEAWAHHYRAATHNDMQFHPQRTADAILQILKS